MVVLRRLRCHSAGVSLDLGYVAWRVSQTAHSFLVRPTHGTAMIVRLGSRWFSRRWVIQELALAKDTEVRCGEKSVHWRDFGDAISLFVMHFEQIRELLDEKKLLSKQHKTYLG